MTPQIDKPALRARMRAARRAVDGKAAGLAIAGHFLSALEGLGLDRGRDVVAGYWPIGAEADTRPLLHDLAGRGFACALPVVAARDEALLFRDWMPGIAMVPGLLGMPEPGPERAAVAPTVVLVPLLAYDRRGGRLGQGGGYYDRTLAALRARGPVTAVGVALSVQEMPDLPCEAHDEPLDWVVTEQGLIGTETT